MKNSPVHWSHRSVAIVLMAFQPLVGWPLYALATEAFTSPGNVSAARSLPEPIPEPEPVATVNRTLPQVEGPVGFQLSEKPTDQEITECGLFSEPLVPMNSLTDAQGNQDLSSALQQYAARSDADDVSSLTTFCAEHRDSRWRVAVLHNLGKTFYFRGYYSKALATWDEAWQEGKTATDSPAVALANETLAQLARMNARIGRTARLEQLLNESASRQIIGNAAQVLLASKEALYLMRHDPGHSFLCGPLALAEIRRCQHVADAGDQKIAAAESTTKGTSLVQVGNLAAAAGMKYQIAKRDPGASVIAPAVVHWKLGHFAALVKEDHGKYLAKDLTFKNNLWLTRAAIDEEASGYFLIPEGPLPSGWHAVAAAEAADVWGCGGTSGYDPGGETPFDPGCGCGGSGMGMAHYDVKAQAASLTVYDTPVGYAPPVGPGVFFTARYQQHADGQPATFTFSNLGPNWFHDWMAYVVDDPTNPGSDVQLFPPGGGYLNFTGFDSTTQSYALELVSNTTLAIVSPGSYEWRFPDGSKEVFSQPNNVTGTGRQVFLTQIVDAQGNSLTFQYDKKFRLVAARDAIGQVTTLSYNLSGDPYKITKVTDPFGRSATFTYSSVNGANVLTADTDVMGITSKYEYQTGELHVLTTPYGKTTFIFDQAPGGGIGRAVDVFDPEGGHQRVENNQGVDYTFSDELIPAGMNLFNQYLNSRDTFYWDQHAMEIGGYNYLTATRVYHFQHTPDMLETGRLVEAIGQPLESRIWMNYPGQTEPNGSGFEAGVTVGRPSLVGRVVDTNGTTQLTQYSYNALANVTSAIDPAGRATQYTYALNGIDLIQVQHFNGSSYDTVRGLVYNSQHLPNQITDAAGQTTTIQYNNFGEATSVTDPKGEVTTYKYDNNGYLQKVIDALGGTQLSYTYDGFGRVHSFTDVSGFTTTYSYDELNRITGIQYPDRTTDTYKYKVLSLIEHKDRLDLVTRYKYNSLQQLIELIDPEGRTTRYSYCDCGSLTGITDGGGNNTTFIRDGEDRVSQKIYQDNSMATLSYDWGGRLSSIVDAKNQTTAYQYGVDDLLDQITYAAPTPGVLFSYDAYARVASMTDGIGTTNYSYVPAGQLGALQLGSEAKPSGYGTVTFRYDQLNRVESESIDGADTRSWTYDAIGRVSNEANGLGAFTYQFTGSSDLLQTLAEPGQKYNFSYYGATGDFRLQQIQQVASSGTVSNSYTYDPVGNILRWDQQNPSDGTATWNLKYDADNEIQKVTSQVSKTNAGFNLGQGSYADDPGANLTQFTTTSPLAALASAIYTINKLNQITAIAGGSYSGSISYDANGNPENSIGIPSANPATVAGARTYSWDGGNRLIQISYGSGNSNSSSLSYDGLGRLVEVMETVNGAVQNDERYVWIGDTMVEQRNAQSAVVKEYFEQGFASGGTAYYYGQDHLGSIRNLTDSTGALQAQLDYGPYGELTEINGQIQPDFAYTGLFYHQRSGLYLAEYRAYDSGIKRWLNRDPMFEITGEDPETTAGPNLYAYVNNTPTGGIDLLGLKTWYLRKIGDSAGPLQNGDVVKSVSGNVYTYHSGIPEGYLVNQRGQIFPAADTVYLVPGGGISNNPPYKNSEDTNLGKLDTGWKIIPKKPRGGGNSGGGGVLPPPGNGGDNGGGGNGGSSGSAPGPAPGTNGNGNGGNSTWNAPTSATCRGKVLKPVPLKAPPAGKL